MIKNYFKVALRSLRQNSFFTFINVFGLALGVISCSLISIYVLDELSYDKYHANSERIHRVDFHGRFGGNDLEIAQVGAPVGESMRADFPEVEDFVRFRSHGSWLMKYEDPERGPQSFKEEDVIYADSNFFDFFSVKLLKGDPLTCLTRPNTVVLDEVTAKKFFGDADPLGKTVVSGGRYEYEVTGVFEEIPTNTHFDFSVIASLVTLDEVKEGIWMSMNFNTYVRLKEGASAKALEEKFPAMVETYIGPEIEKFIGASLKEFRSAGNEAGFSMTPLLDIHLHSDLDGELAANGDIKYVYIFSAIALFILLIACINFMNLSTARSAKRAKEVGIRKVLGSYRIQLVGQFLAESTLLSFLSFLIAMLVIPIAMPYFNELAGKDIQFSYLDSWMTVPLFMLAVMLVGLIAGSYPAFFLASFQPIAVLKGKVKSGMKSGLLRNVLVVLQFSASIFLIIGTVVIYKQLNFVQNTKLGFNKEQVLILNDAYVLRDNITVFKNEMLNNANVESASVSGFLPVASNRNNNAFFPENQPDSELTTVVCAFNVDTDYIGTMGMEIIKGRNFDENRVTDSTGIVVNEALVKHFGWEKPLGMRLGTFTSNDGKIENFEVIGVVKDFHYSSLRNNIDPLLMHLDGSTSSISFRLKTENVADVITSLEANWKKMAPGNPFNYTFMDEEFNDAYRAEQRTGNIFGVFSFLAIFIACLGLFGLATFTAEQRTKEIGVRKVLGASVGGIVLLLSKDFGKLILISFALAMPLGWYTMKEWLSDFAYRTNIGWEVFALAGVASFLVAWLTISYQSVKAARANPVKSLKYE
ncbi:ABC transporter permease [Flammeovirgaceae bacterium SG7u.111]|nr:ABC transporter permease [Flammeovirgaceae bacterium SG7u.132]WPO34593.1 ABC transporter permease [Flammeovirgaceae bacterium SG7u.111]